MSAEDRFKVLGEAEHISQNYVPKYLKIKTNKEFGFLGKTLFGLVKAFIKVFVYLVLDPRKGRIGNLDPLEVEQVYRREARRYDSMHHLTTRGQDLEWRRQAGFFVLKYLLIHPDRFVKVVDICTGTGLTVKEMCRVLDFWGPSVQSLEITGLDYSLDMLEIARRNSLSTTCHINIARGDATKLVGANSGFLNFQLNSIDLVTQMFGIGGIDKPVDCLVEVLKVLRAGGQYFLVDMHRPIKELPGEWFFFGKWLQMPVFENRVYEEITMPLVLKRKWAWRDTTPLFYIVRLVNYFDEDSQKNFGFRVISFEYQAERWWLSLPIMPVAKIIVEKIEISQEEVERRNLIISKM